MNSLAFVLFQRHPTSSEFQNFQEQHFKMDHLLLVRFQQLHSSTIYNTNSFQRINLDVTETWFRQRIFNVSKSTLATKIMY